MKTYIYSLCFCLIATWTFGQYASSVTYPDTSMQMISDTQDVAVRLASTIRANDLSQHLHILADDNMEGRETGHPGNDKAAEYISNHFTGLGLTPIGLENSHFQHVAFTWTSWDDISMHINEERYRHLWDFISFPNKNEHLPEFSADEVIFLGYGIDDGRYSDYRGNNVQGKVILIYKGEPMKADSTYWMTNSETPSSWTTNPDQKLIVAKRHGVKLVLIIEDQIQDMLSKNRRFLLGPMVEMGDRSNTPLPYANSAYISTNMARALMGDRLEKVAKSRDRSRKKGKACDVKLKPNLAIQQSKQIRTLVGKNVMGYIEGSDKKDELIVISAHYDHLGKRGDDIFNGADDNGSGTSTVLDIAEAFAIAKRHGYGPRRSVLCLLVTGEEKGLLGSAYYAKHPVFPLPNTVANVNVDMVGRIDEKYAEQPNYIYVIGSDRLSSDLHTINEDVNQKYAHLILDYTYNSESDPNRYYYRSDHYNFAEKGIPAIFYFNGTHDDYHRPSDTVEKIEFGKMEKVGRLIFHTAWELANRDDRIRVDGS